MKRIRLECSVEAGRTAFLAGLAIGYDQTHLPRGVDAERALRLSVFDFAGRIRAASA
ncbi:hypothetical protein [Streptomyces sp. NPDC057579]|uniref:hypothetical protein n=1 Tax=unclassified Streptomyces TaxID=2593676 RepID=UPI0036C8A40A